MGRLAPKPILKRVEKVWRHPSGMVYAVAQDMMDRVWIVQSCMAGTQCWTTAQAAQLTDSRNSRHFLQEAVQTGKNLEARLQAERAAALQTANEREENRGASTLTGVRPLRSRRIAREVSVG